MNVALHPDSLNLISICTGGGGLDLGVELAIPRARSVCLVEREAFAVSQLVSAMQQGLMAPAPVWSDARTFNGRAWRGAVDGLIGGIPCQPHSLAGKRLERQDERDLWSTARRIIVQSGAWFVLIENVEGMLSSGGAERVYRDLGRLGFAREVGLFTAAEVGASHQRGRTFILAVADARNARPQGREFGGPSGEWDGAEASESAPELCRALVEHAGSGRRVSRGGHGEAGQRPAELKLANPDFAMVDAPGLGRGEGRTEPSLRSGRRSTASADSAMGHPIGSGRAGRADGQIEGAGRRAAAERAVSPTGIFPPGPDYLSRWADVLSSAPELEPAFRRMADGLASRMDTARVDRLRMLGNGVVPLQAAYAVRTLATRLAISGSTGAARLVRMMEQLS